MLTFTSDKDEKQYGEYRTTCIAVGHKLSGKVRYPVSGEKTAPF
jgi:hypothetical protein